MGWRRRRRRRRSGWVAAELHGGHPCMAAVDQGQENLQLSQYFGVNLCDFLLKHHLEAEDLRYIDTDGVTETVKIGSRLAPAYVWMPNKSNMQSQACALDGAKAQQGSTREQGMRACKNCCQNCADTARMRTPTR